MSEHRYEGTWKIPNIDNEQEGILFIDKDRGMIRLKLFVMGDDGIGFGHRIKTVYFDVYLLPSSRYNKLRYEK